MDDAAAAPGHLEAGLFHGPARLGPWMGLLRRMPFPVTEQILAALAIADGVLHRGRFRRASTWAADRGARGWDRWRMALALLANHGRFVAEEALLRREDPDDPRRRVVVHGEEYLGTLSGGALLLGFHLGPPKSWLHLRALGHPVRFAGRLETAARDPRWQPFLDAGIVIRLPEGDTGARLRSLHRMRGLLQDGALVYLTADGPFGHEAFRIDLRGGPLIVRAGWLALRRATGAPTLPVFSYRDGNRRVIVIHPPLPHPDGDPVRDTAACRAALTPLVEEYVGRFPTQCRWVAMPRWPAEAAPAAAAARAS